MDMMELFDRIVNNPWFVGIVSGLVSGALVGRGFYLLGGKDLKREAGELAKLTILILRALEHAGHANFTRDASGKPIGLIFEQTVSHSISCFLEGSATVAGEEAREGK